MEVQHFIIIRFSIRRKQAFQNNPKDKLFSPERLSKRFALFERICLPSLVSLISSPSLSIFVVTDSGLPIAWRERLEDGVKVCPAVTVLTDVNHCRIASLRPFIQMETQIVLTTRLDDDDALHPDFHRIMMQKYANSQYLGHIVTFSRGFFINFDTGKLIPKKYPFNSCGLTMISDRHETRTIYGGNHSKWKRKRPCLEDKQPEMFVMSVHDYNSSGRRLTRHNPGVVKQCVQSYPFLTGVLALNST